MLSAGVKVEHPEFGVGVIKGRLGEIAQVIFYGEQIDIPVEELRLVEGFRPAPVITEGEISSSDPALRCRFRKAFEAINLGVVPPDPDQLIALTIGGEKRSEEIRGWLYHAATDGICKVVFGYYGAGKSHYLNLARNIAIQNGWVVSYLEFDPKAADPAKPHLIYRNIVTSLQFPEKEDGSRTLGFLGLIKEIREKWNSHGIRREAKYFSTNPWYSNALEILLKYPHSQDEDYVAACEWLAGGKQPLSVINGLAARKSCPNRPPKLPQVKESSDIYVFQLVTIHHLCQVLGYKGLMIVLDEAEHVRGYNVKRKERANNLFDLLARAAHPPIPGDRSPIGNDHGMLIPTYWNDGPHFGVMVGLTEGSQPLSGQDLREECVFLHEDSDRIMLSSPMTDDYGRWCEIFLTMVHTHFPFQTEPLSTPDGVKEVASALQGMYEKRGQDSNVLRNWIKLASLVPSMLLSGRGKSVEEIISIVHQAASGYFGDMLPWEM